jgi:hypothetical protein
MILHKFIGIKQKTQQDTTLNTTIKYHIRKSLVLILNIG